MAIRRIHVLCHRSRRRYACLNICRQDPCFRQSRSQQPQKLELRVPYTPSSFHRPHGRPLLHSSSHSPSPQPKIHFSIPTTSYPVLQITVHSATFSAAPHTALMSLRVHRKYALHNLMAHIMSPHPAQKICCFVAPRNISNIHRQACSGCMVHRC